MIQILIIHSVCLCPIDMMQGLYGLMFIHFYLQQRDKSLKIAENLQQVEEWKERSNNLLYSMIPQSIADRLKNGEDPINTCEVTCQFINLLYSMIPQGIADRLKNGEGPINACEVIFRINNLLYSMIHDVTCTLKYF